MIKKIISFFVLATACVLISFLINFLVSSNKAKPGNNENISIIDYFSLNDFKEE